MSIQLSKGKQLLFYLAILLTNVIVMHDFVIYPIVNILYKLFPDSVIGVNFIISGPAIFAVASSLFAPFMMRFMKKKSLLSLICIIFTISSIFEAAIVALPYMILTRSICGFCYGVIQVVAIDIVTDYFTDENKRAAFMGIYNASMAATGAVMGMVAGNLAVIGWKNVYYTYFLAIPMTLLVLFCVPHMKAEKETADENSSTEIPLKKIPMGSQFWCMLINYILFTIGYVPIMMFSAVYIAENNLGNEAMVGLVSSVGTVTSCICCLFFGVLFSKMKARTSLIFYAGMALGLLGIYFLPEKNIFIANCALCGAAYGMMFAYVCANAPSIVAPQNTSKAISYVTAGNGFAIFIGTYVITGLMNVVPGHTLTAVFLIVGIVVAACMIVEFINTGRMKEQ